MPAMNSVSALAPSHFPSMLPVSGVRLAVLACGLRYVGRDDLMIAELATGTFVAGAFTQSSTAAAPVEWCRKALAGGRARAIVANSGNANAFTGKEGDEAVIRSVNAAAHAFDCDPTEVFVASTGVIGEPIADEKIVAAFAGIEEKLLPTQWEAAARAIMTTDTFPKGATRKAEIGGCPVTINGIAKGSGMIAPNMATMLAFIFTDAAIEAEPLQSLLQGAVNQSFNCITVDGDTSTSDTILLVATGTAVHAPIVETDDPRLDEFRAKLTDLSVDLAQQIVRDGEGASKFVTIRVSGAEHDGAARQIAMSIANSPLVKTAIAGEDANWGRIVMAVGKSGAKADRSQISISIGGHPVAKQGSAHADYDESPVAAHMKGQYVDVDVDVGVGAGRAIVWTCDLTHGYIDINADYRT